MDTKILIVTKRKNTLLESIIYVLEREKIEYKISDTINQLEEITNIIYLDYDELIPFESLKDKKVPIIMIENRKKIIKEYPGTINYVIIELLDDEISYTSVQKEYLFKKGTYAILLEKILELLNNDSHYNRMIYDLTEIKTTPEDWIFHFDSIRDTYDWLLKKNASLPDDFIRKGINFYSDKVYDDSLREINYLTQKLMDIKSGRKSIDLFICTGNEIRKFLDNYFFRMLVKNISPTYQIYLVNRRKLEEEEPEIFSKLLDGITIYDDCVYRDTYDDEFSLGFVDCNQKTIDEYNKYFDYIMDKYGDKVGLERDK